MTFDNNPLGYFTAVATAFAVGIVVWFALETMVWKWQQARTKKLRLNDLGAMRLRRALRMKQPRNCKGQYVSGRIL